MPVKNRFAELLPEITAWRRDLHAHPEILFETHRTAAFVAQTLQDIGCDEIVTGIGRGANAGILVKDATSLERLAHATTLLVDKTGTLTEGRPRVVAVAPQVDGIDEADLLALAAAVETHSEHPLARAIVEAARDRGVKFKPADDFESEAGQGAHGRVEGATISD